MPQTRQGDRRPRVVIVGAGFGGLEAARRLMDQPVFLTVIDRRNHHVFQPLLYQVATAGLSPADIAMPVRRFLGGHGNVEVLMDEVTGVDAAARRVITRTRGVPYDYLILAPGSDDSYFGHEAWRTRAPGLKDLKDATDIRRRILLAFERAEMAETEDERRRLMTFVLVGAGPTGVELAGAIAELAKRALAEDFRHIDPRSARILLIEAGPRVLPGFPERLSHYAHRALERLGVEVMVEAPVEQVLADGVAAGGERIAAETVIWSAGVKARPVGDWLDAETDEGGRVKVAPDLSAPGRPEVFVIGDAAHAPAPDGGALPGLAQVAKQEGSFVAEAILRRIRGDERPMRFRYRDRGNLATIGRSAAVADFGRLRLSGWIAWVVWGIVHIYFLIGFRNRFMVFMNWLWNYFTFGRGARLITGSATPKARPEEAEAPLRKAG